MQAATQLFFSRLYGLCVGIGIVTAVSLSETQARRRGIAEKTFWSVVWSALIGGVIGARAYHVLTDFHLYADNLAATLYIWQGGLSIIGGLIGGGLAMSWWLWRQQQLKLLPELLDVAALGLPFGQAIGRLGNFFNQELYGLPTNLPWGIVIDSQHRLPGYETVARYHPLFAYEAIALIIFGVWQWQQSQQNRNGRDGELAFRYIFFYASLRFLLDFLRIEKMMIGVIGLNQVILGAIALVILLLMVMRLFSPDSEKIS